MKKRISAITLFLAIILSISATAVTPRWNLCASVTPSLSFNGNTAYCTVDVGAHSASSQINITVKLYSPSGEELGDWTAPTTKGHIFFSNTYTPESGSLASGTYKMTYSITVSGNGAPDYINSYVTAPKR